MLYAAGHDDDVNASWGSFWYLGGPGFFYGGTNARGLPVPQGLYDIHGGGLGAAPHRDGVPTGGQPNIPSGGISDVERIELQYPFLYLGRNHNRDSGGAGRWDGGAGSYRLLMVRGSTDVTVDFSPYAGMPQGAFGLFGGYPSGTGGLRAVLEPTAPPDGDDGSGAADARPDAALLTAGYPDDPFDALERGLVSVVIPKGGGRVPVAEGVLLSDFVQGGGGFGDPLDRPPTSVARDVELGLVSARIAGLLFGVALDGEGAVDEEATSALRDAIREQRRAGARDAGVSAAGAGHPADPSDEPRSSDAIRFHAALRLEYPGSSTSRIRCRCGYVLCAGDQNYKRVAARRDRPLEELAGGPMPDGSPYLAVLREYACPRCAVLLQVDVWCPQLGGDEDLWDTRIG
jgi:N-methylhydantoinase B